MKFVLDKGYILNNTIQNLIKLKMPIKTIAIATDLTEEEVKKRIKKFNLEG